MSIHVRPSFATCCAATFVITCHLTAGTAQALGEPPISTPYQGCGMLVPGASCPKFQGNDGTTFSIPNTGGFQLGDYVEVAGDICTNCISVCQEGAVFITESIALCKSAAKFDQCGTLVWQGAGLQCLAFHAEDGNAYFLDNISDFQFGDVVRVTSNIITTPCSTACGEFDGCIMNNTISSCQNFVDECGVLVLTPGNPFPCVVFQGDSGNKYGINNIGEFQVNQYVRITGELGEPCLEDCGQLDGCMKNNTIQACGTLVDECGTIVPGGSLPFFCLVFEGDSGQKYGIGNIGNFGLGSRVRVTGLTAGGCGVDGDCGPLDGCLPNNQIIGCPDISGNGTVDVDDLLAVINAWGDCPDQCPEDLNGNSTIDVDDLLIVINHWGD